MLVTFGRKYAYGCASDDLGHGLQHLLLTALKTNVPRYYGWSGISAHFDPSL